MTNSLAKITLWLFIVFLGITFGAGLYEGRIVVPRWLSLPGATGIHWNAAAARQDDTGRRFWAFISTVPLTLLTIASLVGAARSSGSLRVWWLTAALCASADRLLTFSYFIPSMVGLLNSVDSSVAVTKAMFWANLNYLRLMIVFAAWMSALRAFTFLYSN